MMNNPRSLIPDKTLGDCSFVGFNSFPTLSQWLVRSCGFTPPRFIFPEEIHSLTKSHRNLLSFSQVCFQF